MASKKSDPICNLNALQYPYNRKAKMIDNFVYEAGTFSGIHEIGFTVDGVNRRVLINADNISEALEIFQSLEPLKGHDVHIVSTILVHDRNFIFLD